MRKIGILIERQRAFGRQLCTGIVQYSQTREDWQLTMLDTDDLYRPPRLAGFDGFIARIINDEISRAFAKTGRPVVDVFEGDRTQRFAKVIQDADEISRLAADHFIQHRFTTFGFFGHEGMVYSDMRRKAFVGCLRQQGHDCVVYSTPQAVIRNFEYAVMRKEVYSTSAEARSIASWVKKLPKPIAVFASHDLRAYQLARACKDLGVAVPSEVAILGVDNDEILCNFTEPTISSIDPNACGIGFAAAKTLDEIIDGRLNPPHVARVSPSGLVERKSTATFSLNPQWISDALVFMHDNVQKRLSAADIYRHVGRSHTVVDGAFREVLGTTVSKAIADTRMKEAHRLVCTTSIPLAEAAERSGFASVQYFTRSFTAAYGKPPSAMRSPRPPGRRR